VAILIKALTDNRNRTVAEVRSTMNKKGGNMGEAGCVAWIFESKGIIEIPKDKADEETLFELALELGAEDVKDEGDVFQVVTEVGSYFAVKSALQEKKYEINYSEVTMKPKNTITLGAEDLRKLFNITDSLEDLDDVQEVFSNFDADEATMAAMEE